MNYYEELGLAPSAAAEEIRQAYKSLARLLHPDRQSDAHLRKMAELQMTRLNDILAELTDPVRRQRYDTALQESTATRAQNHPRPRTPPYLNPLRPGRLRLNAGAIVWSSLLVATAIGFAFVFLYFEHDPSIVVYHPTDETARQKPAPANPKAPITAPVSHLTPLPPVERSSHVFKGPPQRHDEPLPPPEPEPISSMAQHFETAPPRLEIAPPAAVVPSLIGTWLYVKPKIEEAGNKNLSYRPEYIEMIVKPGQQGVSGKYRGQFHVPDRPLSSEVVLRFEGAAREGMNVFPWQGDDGSSGQIRMDVISDGVVEVSWYTTRFGNAQKLASGTALLHRD